MSLHKEAAVYILLNAIFSLFDEGKKHSNVNPYNLEPAGTSHEFSFSVQAHASDFCVLVLGVESTVLKCYQIWKSAEEFNKVLLTPVLMFWVMLNQYLLNISASAPEQPTKSIKLSL